MDREALWCNRLQVKHRRSDSKVDGSSPSRVWIYTSPRFLPVRTMRGLTVTESVMFSEENSPQFHTVFQTRFCNQSTFWVERNQNWNVEFFSSKSVKLLSSWKASGKKFPSLEMVIKSILFELELQIKMVSVDSREVLETSENTYVEGFWFEL